MLLMLLMHLMMHLMLRLTHEQDKLEEKLVWEYKVEYHWTPMPRDIQVESSTIRPSPGTCDIQVKACTIRGWSLAIRP